jgi:heavy metal sensor kinase
VRTTIRGRLTLSYTAALLAVLVAYASFVSLFLQNRLSAELDRALAEDVERAEERLEGTDDGRLVWRGRHASEAGDEDEWIASQWLEVWATDGRLLLRGPAARPLGLDAPAVPSTERSLRRSVAVGGARVRVLDARTSIGGVPVVVRAARSEERYRHDARELLLAHAVAVPLAIVLCALFGYSLAKRALAPVARMTESARRINAERLSERLPVGNPDDELGRLASAFNDTFARLERSFERLRRFTADVSHELRTPLTAIRSVGEVGLADRRPDKTYRDVIGSILEETDRLTTLVDTLLTLSRADQGELRLERARVDLHALAREVADDLMVLAEEKQQSLSVLGNGGAEIVGDRVVLQQALVNLVGNALQHSPPGTPVRVVVSDDRESARVDVIDQGPGIAAEHQGRVFERFYRIDGGRSRDNGGAGLGLSLVKWAVEAHAGCVALESTPGAGSKFRITLPKSGRAEVDAS